MKKTPEFLLAIIIIILIIAGVAAYVLTAPRANAPTTATSTAQTATSQPATATAQASTTTYTDPSGLYTFNYPAAFNLSGGMGTYSQDWEVNSTADGILLVKVTVPRSFEPGTNFVDANFTVGTSAHPAAVSSCLSAPTSDGPVQKSQVTRNGITYTKFVSTGVGAGNIYETTSYRTIHNGQCYAIEYTIHSGNIQNYPSGAVAAFDHAKIQNALEGIVSSFKFRS